MTEEEAKKLVRDAIAAGIINDMGSGSNVDLAIIKPNDSIEVNHLFVKNRASRQIRLVEGVAIIQIQIVNKTVYFSGFASV